MNGSGSSALRVVIQGDMEPEFRKNLTELIELAGTPSLDDADVAPLLVDADVWISKRFTAGMAASANRLRLVQTIGIGTNEVDMNAVPDQAAVCNVTGHERGMAEYAVMALLAMSRDLLGMDRRLRQADWRDRFYTPPKPELRGRTLGIIGLGRIGRELARIARVFDMRVIAVTRRPDQSLAHTLGLDYLGEISDLHYLLSEADFVVVAVPLESGTAGLIGTAELRAMKPTSYLINFARGRVVDELALYEALRDRTIAGATIDTWYQYPEGDREVYPSQYPFHELENVVMTPHVAGWTDLTFQERWRQMNENVRRLAAGEPLINVVKPARSAATLHPPVPR